MASRVPGHQGSRTIRRWGKGEGLEGHGSGGPEGEHDAVGATPAVVAVAQRRLRRLDAQRRRGAPVWSVMAVLRAFQTGFPW